MPTQLALVHRSFLLSLTAASTDSLSRAVLPLGLLVLAAVGCGSEPQVRHGAGAPLERKVVRVAAAQQMAAAIGDEVVGTIKARNVSAIAASLMGHVSSVKVSLGSHVRAGDLLVQLSAEEITAKLGQANATYAQAELERKRAEQLLANQTIPAAQYDLAVARFNVAKEALAEAEVMRGYTSLRAPFSGVITSKQCEVGDLALPGKPLLVLETEVGPRFEAYVPEATAQSLRRGRELSVKIDSLQAPLQGTVAELSPSADPQSRTVLVKLDLPPLPAGEGLRPGMFGRLSVATGEASALVVPADAVLQRGQLELVFVVDGDRALLRLVRTGRRAGGLIELLSGLSPGERVVVSPPQALVDGQPVEVQS